MDNQEKHMNSRDSIVSTGKKQTEKSLSFGQVGKQEDQPSD